MTPGRSSTSAIQRPSFSCSISTVNVIGLPSSSRSSSTAYADPSADGRAATVHRRREVGFQFVVAWVSYEQDGSYDGAFGRRFSRAGAPLGPEFQVNSITYYDQSLPALGVDPGGGFVVAWQSQDQDGSGLGVVARRFSCLD